jgi:hypothetical protein
MNITDKKHQNNTTAFNDKINPYKTEIKINKSISMAYLSVTDCSSCGIGVWKKTLIKKPFGFSQNPIAPYSQIK